MIYTRPIPPRPVVSPAPVGNNIFLTNHIHYVETYWTYEVIMEFDIVIKTIYRAQYEHDTMELRPTPSTGSVAIYVGGVYKGGSLTLTYKDAVSITCNAGQVLRLDLYQGNYRAFARIVYDIV